jgi:hypothetical protein
VNSNARSTIVSYLEELMLGGYIQSEVVPNLTKFIDDVVSKANEEVIKALVKKIKDWEDTMGDDDKSLYTLGMRQTVDVLRGDAPNHAEEYKPLDEDDFRI